MDTKPLKVQFWTMLGVTALCLVMYWQQSQQTAGTWFNPADMPEVFTPRQMVAEVWCACWFVLALVASTGGAICMALARTLACR